jgi:O-antigen/teichoic acid export membrane protein
MRIVLRWALTSILVLIAAFCCFGFGASGELDPEFKPDGLANPFRWLYGAMVVACVVAIVAVWRANLRWALTSILVLITALCCMCFLVTANPFGWLYGATVVVCVAAIVAVWRAKALRH